MTKLCVFDCDGTLVDSHGSISVCMSTAFSSHGLPSPAGEAVKRVVGLSLADAVAALAPTCSDVERQRISNSYVEAFADLRLRAMTSEPLFPGVDAGLQALEDAGWTLGLATGKSLRGAMATLSVHGLEKRFITVQTADGARGKPHPDMLLKAMTEAGTEPSRTAMIGDTTYDMMMARHAGAFAVAVTWGYHSEAELRDAGADAVVRDFADITAVVQVLIEGRG